MKNDIDVWREQDSIQIKLNLGLLTPLTPSEAEELLSKLHKTLRPHSGRSIQEEIWRELDAIVGLGGNRDRAYGLAWALAIMRNPVAPNVDEIRQEAGERKAARAAGQRECN